MSYEKVLKISQPDSLRKSVFDFFFTIMFTLYETKEPLKVEVNRVRGNGHSLREYVRNITVKTRIEQFEIVEIKEVYSWEKILNILFLLK